MQHFWWVSDPCHEHVMSATQIVLEPDPNHQSFDDDIFVSRQILRPWCTDFNCRVNSPLENGLLQCLTKNANFAMKLIQKLRRHRQHHFHLYVLGYIFFKGMCSVIFVVGGCVQIAWLPISLPLSCEAYKWKVEYSCNG